jgi:hypothetical protein
MLRLPSARGPNSMRPCIQATMWLFSSCETAASIARHGFEEAEAELAVFERFFDFLRR